MADLARLLSVVSERSLPEAALVCVEAGVPVFPCEPWAKRPLTGRGFIDATIRSLNRGYREATPGIEPGRAGDDVWRVFRVRPAQKVFKAGPAALECWLIRPCYEISVTTV